MKRLHHVATVGLCLVLCTTGTIKSDSTRELLDDELKKAKNAQSVKGATVATEQADEEYQEVTDEQIKTSKPGRLFNIVKALAAGGLMLGISQVTGIKGTGFEAGFMFGALPLAWGIGSDDPVTKVTCFSATTACVVIGGAGGSITTDVVIGQNGILQRLPLESFKNLATWLRNCKGNIANSIFEQAKNAAAAANQQFHQNAAMAEAAAQAAAQLRTTAGGIAIIGGLTSQLGGFAFDSAGRFVGKYQIALDNYVSHYINKLKSRKK